MRNPLQGNRSDIPIDIPEDQFVEYAISVIKKEWWFFPDYIWLFALIDQWFEYILQ
jgi:hypothetical protein